jgi:lysophospholipase L1-like esterase
MPLLRTTSAFGALLLVLALTGCTPAVATTTALTASPSTTTVGASVRLTATVSSPLGTALTGAVAFFDGSVPLGSRALSGGAASLTTSALAPGTRTVTARFTPSRTGYRTSQGTTTVTVQRFHLALGDSLAAGAGAPSGQGYVPLITAAERSRLPGLTLRNLSCGGATTATMLTGGGSCGYTQDTQLGAAEAFLLANPGAVSFITIDIGANDVSRCVSAAGTDPVCAATRLPIVQSNLGQILSRLRAAAPGVPIIGMTYYNPFLAFWVIGNPSAADSSNAAALTFNDALSATYEAAAVPVAPVEAAFGTEDTALTGTYLGATVPQNVANICTWTHMCARSDIHANTDGHARIARAFLPVIDSVVPAG